MGRTTFRRHLRAYQKIHADDSRDGFLADLEYLENRDLDLSVRLGAMLAFNALLITIGTHPISASPGAPLSVDAASHPAEVIASILGIAPFVLAAALVLRALLIGEEPDAGDTDDREKLRRALFAAFIRSIDAQSALLRRAVQLTFAGGALTLLVWVWIIVEKIVG